MRRHPVLSALAAALALTPAACNAERDRTTAAQPPEAVAASEAADIGEPLYRPAEPPPEPYAPAGRDGVARDPVVLTDCRLSVFERQDVPSQREGVLLVVGTEVRDGQDVAPDRRLEVRNGDAVKKYSRLKEGDRVEAGQLLAQLDDRLARDDHAIKTGKLAAARADLAAAEKTRDEAQNRFETQSKLLAGSKGAVAAEEVRATRLTWDRYRFEAESKREAVGLAERELHQAETVLAMHQIRAAIPGVIKTIYKKRGEAVKALEPVFQVHDLSRLRAEGLADVEALPRLRAGQQAVVEPCRPEGPDQTLLGHLQAVTAVAVGGSPKTPLIVSAGEDHSVRVWERTGRGERRILWHPAAVRAVACLAQGTSGNRCLSGAADGAARLWDLDGTADQPLRVLSGHQGPVTCVAFSPDGATCATGGEDRDVCLWDAATGELRYRLPAGHRAALTMLHFTPAAKLVTAGRDNTLRLWVLGTKGARLELTLDRRSGEVAYPGVSPSGHFVLLDQGKALRLLTLPGRLTAGVLANAGEAAHFTTFALFSPDGRLVVTAGAAEGRLQLWRAPTATTRPYELRQLADRDRSPATCAAFAPDGSFLVTGTQDRQVLVWPLPGRAEVERQQTARVTLVEQAVESSARQVKVWAEVDNADGRLLPGTTVSLALDPDPR